MTASEARKNIEQCENNIQGTFEQLCLSANNLGESTEAAAQKALSISRLWGVIPFVLGILICYLGGFFIVLGLILLFSGCIRIATGKSSKSAALNKIQEERLNLTMQTAGKRI